jgi:hypothetical protein
MKFEEPNSHALSIGIVCTLDWFSTSATLVVSMILCLQELLICFSKITLEQLNPSHFYTVPGVSDVPSI